LAGKKRPFQKSHFCFDHVNRLIGRNCYDAEKSEPVVFARVPCVEFEVRNEGQNQNKITFFKVFLFFSTAVTLALQTPSSKVTVTGDGGNNRGGWGRSPQRYGDFSIFFQKIKHFYAYFGLNFCLKDVFK